MFCTIYDFVYFYKYANKPILHILISETYVVQLSDTSYMWEACSPRMLKCSFTFVLLVFCIFLLQLFRVHRQVLPVSVYYMKNCVTLGGLIISLLWSDVFIFGTIHYLNQGISVLFNCAIPSPDSNTSISYSPCTVYFHKGKDFVFCYCYNDSYIYHDGEFWLKQECHHFINVRKIDWWVDFICTSPSVYNYLCNQCLSPLTSGGENSTSPMTRATIFNCRTTKFCHKKSLTD
jgi:hypothetical protein